MVYNTQKNKIENHFHIGDFISLFDTITIYSLVKQSLSQFSVYQANKQSYLTNFNIGSDYLLRMDFESLSIYNSFLFFGFNSRYEASLLNICLARLTENNDSSFFQFNTGFENFFAVSHKGGHHKNIKNFLEGRSFFLSTLRLDKVVKTLYGISPSKHIKKSENVFNFISNKFSDKATFMTHDFTTLNYIEFFGGSLKQAFYKKRKKIQKGSLVNGWFLNSPKKTQALEYSDILEWGLRDKKTTKKKIDIFIPIKFFYEDHDASLNLFGKIYKTEKVTTSESSLTFSLKTWFLFFSFFSFEERFSIFLPWVYKILSTTKYKKNFNQLNLHSFKITFLSNLNYSSLITYFTNLNVYSNNTERFLHTFNIKTNIVFNKNYFLFNFIKSSVLSFYLNYDLLSYSFTMTNSSFIYADNLFLK